MQNILMGTLARAEYAAPALRNAKQLGAQQYVDFNTRLAPFKLPDAEGMRHSRILLSSKGRISQIEIPCFAKDEMCFCNMLGLSFDMPIIKLQGLMGALSRIFKEGSTVVLDRPENEPFEKMEKLLSDCGFLIYEYIMSDEIQARFLDRYNTPDVSFAPITGISFYMAVKKTV
ncbi:MAG: hypothetical protein E7441_02240 [Ruminococcaceae bacterium]|nr:hypothetical protein [Oscillospiraceae bacterium]